MGDSFMASFKNKPVMSSTVFLHPVFLLDVQYNGYGIVRTFSRQGIPVYGFFENGFCYEYYSRLFHKFIYLEGNETDYLKILLDTAKPLQQHKPVLIVTSGFFQEFVGRFYDELKAVFIFEIPPFEALKVFLEKDLFKDFATRLNVTIPLSYEVNRATAQSFLNQPNMPFPLIIKPKYRDPGWYAKYPLAKVFVATDHHELESICGDLFKVVDRLIWQEWIPGPDSNIYYCLTYIKPGGEVLTSFCGRKIHQHPILLGSTSSAEAADEPFVMSEGLRILTQNGNHGFCSVEFKKHAGNGRFYVVEPTVGRINQQEVTAALDGVDIVLDAYCHLTGIPKITDQKRIPGYYYIDEIMDLQSCMEYAHFNRFSWWQYLRTIWRRRLVFLYINRRDPMLSFRVMVAMAKHIGYYLVMRRPKYHSNDSGTEKLLKTFQGDASQF
jgi:D-aspartate ligase